MNILSPNQELPRFKFFNLLAITSITTQLACNCIVGKLTIFFYGFLPASALVYPLCYALGDIIADVYGYSLSRELIWLNIYAQLLFGIIINLALLLPSPNFWSFHEHYQVIFGTVLKNEVGSAIAVFFSAFINAYLVSKFKIKMYGEKFWLRSMFASIISEGLLVLIAYTCTFSTLYSFHKIIVAVAVAWSVKCIFVFILMIPSAFFRNYLIKKEGVDWYDQGVNYNPFILRHPINKVNGVYNDDYSKT